MTYEAETMVERIARALFANDEDFAGELWEYACEADREKFLPAARAVLTALLDPTEEMVEAGRIRTIPVPLGNGTFGTGLGLDGPSNIWRRMIQAALQPGSKDKDSERG